MSIGSGFSSVSEITKGTEAPRLVLSLPSISEQLGTLNFTIYTPRDGVDERLAKSSQKSASDTVKESLRNDDDLNEKWIVLATDLCEEVLIDKIASLAPGQALGIDSACLLRDGKPGHIPMMDFKLPPEDSNIEIIKIFLESKGREGVLLHSGNSFHYLGFDVKEPQDWNIFLGQCLLARYADTKPDSDTKPYVDTRWIGHSLVSATGVLRITGNERKPKVPSVCATFFRQTNRSKQ